MLVIAETVSATWHYHLRRVVDGKLYPGGAAPPALCGRELGWDTVIPMTAWGKPSHIPTKWCAECERLAKQEPGA